MNVGFIGLGRMGTAMAGSLLRAGHEVTVYNRTPSNAQALIDRGARLAARELLKRRECGRSNRPLRLPGAGASCPRRMSHFSQRNPE